jgi:6-phosphogluconate dehydrogenase
MEAYAEGYRIIKEGPIENVDLAKVAEVWQHGSINESFLNGLIETMLKEDAEFSSVEGKVHESGEARWTLETAKELGIETPVIQAAFDVRIRSQEGEINYATKFLAQLRNEFGGHAVNPNPPAIEEE